MTSTIPTPSSDHAPSPKRAKRSRAIGRPSEAVGRESLLDTVCEILRRTPPAEVTLVAVARHAGVHVSLLKYYFRDRGALMSATADRLMAQVQAAMDEAVSLPNVSPEQLLRARIRALLTLQTEQPNFHRLILDEIVNSDRPEAKAMVTAMTAKGVDFYAAVLDEGVRQGVMRPSDPLMLYFSIVGLTEFFVSGNAVLLSVLVLASLRTATVEPAPGRTAARV